MCHALDDVTDIIGNPFAPETVRRRESYLADILDHATNTTAFYSKYSGSRSLADFPIINKAIIRENSESLLSRVIAADQRFPVVTSGSTGTPLKVFHDRGKRTRNTADTIHFAGRAGFEIGSRLLYLKIWPPEKRRSAVHYRVQNVVPVDVSRLSDEACASIVAELRKGGATFGIIGYASALEMLAQYMERKGTSEIKGGVTSIIAISESLNEHTREILGRVLCSPVVSRYSNLENGIIAQQDPYDLGRYVVNNASYTVEVLRLGSDEAASPGEAGRIVITDLFNRAMPLIRYDTGDVGVLSAADETGGAQRLARVEGRKMDLLYNTRGELISSLIVYRNMWKYTEILQYQLVQKDRKSYRFRINVNGVFGAEAQLVREFKEFLGKDADFRVEYVSGVPLLASGKRRMIVNEHLQTQAAQVSSDR